MADDSPTPAAPTGAGGWLTMTDAEAEPIKGRPLPSWSSWHREAVAQRAAKEAAERELGWVIQAIRHDDCCPTANNEGFEEDDADEPGVVYRCLGEDGEPIIEATRPADVVLGILRCWGATQERAEKAEVEVATLTAKLEAAERSREAGAWQPVHPDPVTADGTAAKGRRNGGDRT